MGEVVTVHSNAIWMISVCALSIGLQPLGMYLSISG